MPELPEVQTVVDDLLRAGLTGCTVVACRVAWPRSVAEVPAGRFTDAVCGRRVTALSRRGKFIVIRLSGGLWLLVHLRMTGRLVIADPPGPPGKHEHVVFGLDDGRDLRFYDPRKFGRLRLVEDPARVLGPLGPEPLGQDFTARLLAERLAGRRRAIKPLLLDQTFLAGLGNIYTDEALWEARLHPLRRGDDLNPAEVRRLHRAIGRVLRQGLANGGTTLGHGQGNFVSPLKGVGANRGALKVFRRTGGDCPRCGTAISRIVVGQRASHFCPNCQPPAASGL